MVLVRRGLVGEELLLGLVLVGVEVEGDVEAVVEGDAEAVVAAVVAAVAAGEEVVGLRGRYALMLVG
jgi:hypothetical protein